MRATRRGSRRCSTRCGRMIHVAEPAAACHRPRARHRDRRRMPARVDVRSRGRRRHGRLRPARREHRRLLLDAGRGRRAQRRPQTRDGNAAHRRACRCPDGARLGSVNRVVPGDALDAAVRHFTDIIKARSPATIRLGKQAFYAQIEQPIAAAYEASPRSAMACNMLARRCRRRHRRVPRKAAAGLAGTLTRGCPTGRRGYFNFASLIPSAIFWAIGCASVPVDPVPCSRNSSGSSLCDRGPSCRAIGDLIRDVARFAAGAMPTSMRFAALRRGAMP